MALPATHIRFALVVAGPLGVVDYPSFLAGTLYPDSRWLTGLDRDRTHGDHCTASGFANDDFRRGWQVHCVCDRIQNGIHTEIFGDLVRSDPKENWIRLSAAKVVQDISDAGNVDLRAHLDSLACRKAPNGESAQQVAAYYDLVKGAYNGRQPFMRADYDGLWQGVGLDLPTIDSIGRQVAGMQADADLCRRLADVFDQMVARWKAVAHVPAASPVTTP